MARSRGYAVLCAIIALAVGLSALIYVSVSSLSAVASRSTASAVTADGRPGSGSAPGGWGVPASSGAWVGTWAASPVGGEPGTADDGMAGRSVRNVVHTSVGGTSARITLSNLFGTAPLTVTHATIAVAAGKDGADAAEGTMRRVTFGGHTRIVVPPGQEAVSDAVPLAVPYDADLLVTTYAPTSTGPVTYHPQARQTNYVAEGERTADVSGEAFTPVEDGWRYLTAVDVSGARADGTLVTLGDSITDGVTSTRDTDRRWPDVLSDRLREAADDGADVPRYGIANEGISGNEVLADGVSVPLKNPSALSRFDRDVLARPNVRVVVVDLGINDILHHPGPVDPEAVVAGLRSLVERAHARGIKVIGATLMPFRGHHGYSDAREEVRQRINEAIRDGRVYDAVADFDKALRDPYDPRTLREDYDSGDRLHPSDQGYRRMADVLELGELKAPVPVKL